MLMGTILLMNKELDYTNAPLFRLYQPPGCDTLWPDPESCTKYEEWGKKESLKIKTNIINLSNNLYKVKTTTIGYVGDIRFFNGNIYSVVNIDKQKNEIIMVGLKDNVKFSI